MDIVKVLGRIVTILPFLLAIGIFMGKRSIGELPVFDFLVVLVLGSVVGADIADPKIDHIHTVVAMIAIALIQKLIIWSKLRNRKVGKLLTFEPTIVLYEGKIVEGNLKKIKYSLDNIIQMLREKDIFRLDDVEIAIIEANGQLSVKLKPDKEKVTREDLGITNRGGGYEIPIILDEEIQYDLLKRMNKDEEWLKGKLKESGIMGVQEVFYASVTDKGEVHFSLKGIPEDLPPIEH